MKTAESILKNVEEIAQINGVDFSVVIFNDAIQAMKEYADEYHRERLREKYKPSLCKGCRYWTVVDVLGGEYCRVLEKSVASPRDDYKHKDCPI